MKPSIITAMTTVISALSMLTPLNTIQRHPFLHQLPQRTELSQEADPLRHRFEHIINLALGGKSPNAEPDAAVRAFIAVT